MGALEKLTALLASNPLAAVCALFVVAIVWLYRANAALQDRHLTGMEKSVALLQHASDVIQHNTEALERLGHGNHESPPKAGTG